VSKPKRFIIEKRAPGDEKWSRSGNSGIRKGVSFATQEEAQAAMEANKGCLCEYRVRQK
jgi:hypothetical protein